MTSRRDALTLAVVAAFGVLLGSFATWQPDGVATLAQWLRRGRASIGPPAPSGPTVPSVMRDATHADHDVLRELRALVRAGRAADALVRLEAYRVETDLDIDFPVALDVEQQALRLHVAPGSFRADMATQALGWMQPLPSSSRPDWSRGEMAALLLEHVPAGLGRPADPGRAHARAYVAATVVRSGGAPHRRELWAPLAALVDGDAGRLVDVLGAWAALRPHLDVGDILLESERVRRDVCTDLCQTLLDDADPRALCDGLATIVRDAAWTLQDRALAATALAELANLPIGLGPGLPRDDADAESYPTLAVADAWERVRELAPGAAFAERVTLALESHLAGVRESRLRPGALPAASGRWLVLRLGGAGRDRDATLTAARAIAVGELDPERHLAQLAGDATQPSAIVRRMEGDESRVLALHGLLLLRGEPRGGRAPLACASSDGHGLVIAWRAALGLAAAPFTVRVARLERRLDAPTLGDGLTLVDETRRAAVAGDTIEMSWPQTFDDGTDPDPGWRAPGTLSSPEARTRIEETLRLAVTWTDRGASVRLDNLEVSIRHAHGGGSSSTSGGEWPAELPVALAPWSDHDGAASRRAYLVIVEPGAAVEPAWTLDTWRGAVARAFARTAERARREGSRFDWQRPLSRLAEALAVLRPPVDVARLEDLAGDARWRGAGLSRFLGFAGSRALLRETPGGAPTPSEAARNLSARDVAELALEAPDAEVRAAMWWLLHSERRPDGLVARELLAVAEAQPERVPATALDAARAAIARGPDRSARSVFAAAAATVWALALLLVALCLRGRRRAHGRRAVAVALLVAALFVAQVDVTVAGWPLLPAFAGWGLAAVAVSWIGSAAADTEARRAAIAFVVAAVASVAVYVTGTAAEIVAALAAVAGCVALAPLAPALLRDLVPEGASSLPRKPASATGWRLGARIALPAGLAAGAVAGATMLTPHQIAAAALFYVAIAACFGGVLLWRLSLARGTAQALPAPFAVGLVVPALALLVTESVTRLPDGVDRELPDPFGAAARVWICCALLFALVRLWDAARVRCRADHAAAARPRQRTP